MEATDARHGDVAAFASAGVGGQQPGEQYLGDAVYVSFDGYQLKLRTDDGNHQVIYLEPGVWFALKKYVESIGTRAPDEAPDDHAPP